MLRKVFIANATGHQGRAVIQSLQQLSPKTILVAGSRNPDSPAAQKLTSQGVKVVKVDMNQAASVEEHLRGADAAFLYNAFMMGKDATPLPDGTHPEVATGKIFIDAAVRVKLPFLVMSSVASADQNTGIPHFETKAELERYLKATTLPHYILRPVAFFDTFPKEGGMTRFMMLSFMRMLVPNKVQMVAVEDIGRLAAQALLNNEDPRYRNQTFELAGDDLTIDELVQAYQHVQGTKPRTTWMPTIMRKTAPSEFQTMGKFMRERGYSANIAAARQLLPSLHSAEDWLRAAKQ